jgi:nucleotide-binding universal stress UspA family protein
MRNIAVGVDGSLESRRALEVTATLAAALGAHVDVLHARSLVGFGGAGAEPPAPEPLSETFAALEDQAHAECAEVLDPYRVSWAFAVRLGRPAEVLLGFLEEASVDLLVVGSRGRGLAAPSVLGSTATELVNLSRVPVLVVP